MLLETPSITQDLLKQTHHHSSAQNLNKTLHVLPTCDRICKNVLQKQDDQTEMSTTCTQYIFSLT